MSHGVMWSNAKALHELLQESRAEVADLKAENAKLRELVRCLVCAERPSDRATLMANAAEVWPIAEYAGYEHELKRARELMRELGYEVGE